MLTGDEIRGAKFPRVLAGYDPWQVDSCLADIASALDAGFSPPIQTLKDFRRILRGYDKQAVDHFFEALGSNGAPGYGQLLMSAGHWRVASEEPALGDGPSARGHPARPTRAERRQYAEDCDAGWLCVADLPGTRLGFTWHRIRGDARNQITGSDGKVLLIRRSGTWTVAATGQEFRFRQGQVVDAVTGDPILQMIGLHTDRQAKAVVLRSQRRCFRFPVQCSRLRNAVMTAVDETGAEVLWFRKTGTLAVEVVASPDCDLTPEILCVIELAAPLLGAYFTSEGGGGG